MGKRTIKKLDDGDSGIFANGDRFRLNRVRAPEKGNAAETAKRVLAGMLGRDNWQVNVKEIARGHYGRILVELSNSEGSINDRMRERGYTDKGR